MAVDLTFDADLDIGEYVPNEGETEKPHMVAVRLYSPKIPVKMEFVTNDAAVLEGWIELFTEQIGKMKACPANEAYYGKNPVVKGAEAIAAAHALLDGGSHKVGDDTPNSPVLVTEQGEGD